MSTVLDAALPASPDRLLGAVRREWLRGAWARWACRGVAAALVLAAALVVIDMFVPLPAPVRVVLRWLPPLALAACLARAAMLHARTRDRAGLALLAQEHIPTLENRLATAIEIERSPAGPVRDAFLADLERTLARIGAPASLRPKVRGPLAASAAVLALATGIWLLARDLAEETARRWLQPQDAYPQAWVETRERITGRVASPPPLIGEIRWIIRPPSYSGLAESRGLGSAPITALAGSRLELRGHFSDRWDEVAATRPSGGAIPVDGRGGEWLVVVAVDAADRGVVVEARAGGAAVDRRTVPVTVRPDDPPEVRLTAPANDLVLASASGRISVAAAATDDFGVGSLHLSWSRTRGSGETFEYVDGEWPLQVSARPGGLGGTRVLDLAALALQAGDVLHLRAVARDRNDVTGPGESVSATRTIRIARPDELDLVNTDVGFPMELPENPLLSQRMIVLRTERLRDQSRTLGPVETRRRASALAVDQSRLREQVGEQVFTRATGAMQDPFADLSFTETGGAPHAHAEGAPAAGAEQAEDVLEEASEATGQGTLDEVSHRHDSAPILDVNRTMQRLYDLMWASERELNQGLPAAALPHQYEALKLIQELRRTERRFPRGSVTVDAVDIAAARGTGKLEDAAPAARRPGAPLAGPDAALAELEAASAGLAGQDPRQAALALSALAARLLATTGIDPAAAALVSRAAEDAGRGNASAARSRLADARIRVVAPLGRRRPAPAASNDDVSAEYFRRLGRQP